MPGGSALAEQYNSVVDGEWFDLMPYKNKDSFMFDLDLIGCTDREAILAYTKSSYIPGVYFVEWA